MRAKAETIARATNRMPDQSMVLFFTLDAQSPTVASSLGEDFRVFDLTGMIVPFARAFNASKGRVLNMDWIWGYPIGGVSLGDFPSWPTSRRICHSFGRKLFTKGGRKTELRRTHRAQTGVRQFS
jgi:hypothetical protein